MPKQTSRQCETAPAQPSLHSPQAPQAFEPVELRWILKSLGAIVALSVVCGYITLCVVYSRTQWQLVLHPLREVTKTPESLGMAFTEVRFGPDDSGQPQLDGWWIPGDLPSDPTVILLHSGDGSMSDAMPQAEALHNARLNVLLFDYRGFGHSGGNHPTEATMEADADSALSYLTGTRNITPAGIVVYGSGVGGSLAVRLCTENPQIPALILDHPDGDLKARALADNRSVLIPARLLFTQDFPLAAPLQTLSTPKLLFTTEESSGQEKLYKAADPKMIVTLGLKGDDDKQTFLRRFLDSYMSR